jgi:hypothetical protein
LPAKNDEERLVSANMSIMMTITTENAGCFLDNHRGIYITRDMLWLCRDDFGYIIDPVMSFALAMFGDHSDREDYPMEAIWEESQAALAWLNGGPNEGKDRAIQGQNSPPAIPEGYAWDWYEGDFGLYPTTLFTIHRELVGQIAEDITAPEARKLLRGLGQPDSNIDRLLDQTGEDIPLQVGEFTVTANDNHY